MIFRIVYNLVLDFPKKLYILAVEQTITKQREVNVLIKITVIDRNKKDVNKSNLNFSQIIKPLGRIVGSGMFKCIPQEDGFLIPDIDVSCFSS